MFTELGPTRLASLNIAPHSVRNESKKVIFDFLNHHNKTIQEVKNYFLNSQFTPLFLRINGGFSLTTGNEVFDCSGTKPTSLSKGIYSLMKNNKGILLDSTGRLVLTNLNQIPPNIELPLNARHIVIPKESLVNVDQSSPEFDILQKLCDIFYTNNFAFFNEFAITLAEIVGDDPKELIQTY